MRTASLTSILGFLLIGFACTESSNTAASVDSSLPQAEERFVPPNYDSLRDINNFSAGTGSAYVDSLYKHMLATSELKQISHSCSGDFCAAYQHLDLKNSDSSFYYFKGESGEYGFSNYQYLLWKDSMVYARHFEVNPLLSDDGSSTTWLITEKELHFSPNSAIALIRTDSTASRTDIDFDWPGSPALPKLNHDSAYQATRRQLNELLSLGKGETSGQ